MTGDPPIDPPTRRRGAPARDELVDLALAAGRTGTYEWDLRSGRLSWDERTLELFAYDAGEFDGTIDAFWARVDPHDAPHVRRSVERAIEACGDYTEEFRVRLPGGGERWIAARGRALALPDDPGRAAVMLGAVNDTTEQRQRDARLARVLETMPTAFYSLDHEWRFTYVNGHACRLLRAPRDDLLGRVVWEAFPDAPRAGFQGHYERAKETGLPVSFEVYYPPPLDGWFELHAWPTQDGLAVYFLEVTERHEARERATNVATATSLVADLARVIAHADDAVVPAHLAEVAAAALGGDWGVATLLDDTIPGTRATHAAGWHRDPDAQPLVDAVVDGGTGGPVPGDLMASAVRSGHVVILDSGAARAPEAQARTERGRAALAALAPDACLLVPILSGRRALATIAVFYGQGPVPPTALEVAEQMLRRARVAVENAYLTRRQGRLVEVLQRSLLAPPPPLPGADLAVRYLPASTAARGGGDWYDAFVLPNGDVVRGIGDVGGHDIEAAVAMGQVRALLRGVAAATGLGPGALLDRVDEALGTLGVTTLTTVACVRLHADTDGGREARWAAAGHLPPLVRDPGGVARYLDGGGGLLLGFSPGGARRPERVERLGPGDTLLLYTDGLVERRDRPLRAGLEELRRTIEAVGDRPLEALCDAVVRRMVDGRAAADDVALLAVRLPAG